MIDEMKQGLTEFFAEMKDIAALAHAFLDFIAGFIGYLGPAGFFLFVISLVLLWLVSAASPLDKAWNYLLVVGFVASTYLLRAEAAGAGKTVPRYLSVMAAPLILTHGLHFALTQARRQLGRRDARARIHTLAREIADLSS